MAKSTGYVDNLLAAVDTGCVAFRHDSGVVENFVIYSSGAPGAAARVWMSMLSDAASNSKYVELTHGDTGGQISGVKIFR